MRFEQFFLKSQESVRNVIKQCQNENHVQQVAYSTYHDCLTQICFNCKEIRTSMKPENIRDYLGGDKK